VIHTTANPHEKVCKKCGLPVVPWMSDDGLGWVHDHDGYSDCNGFPIQMIYGPALERKYAFDAPIYYAGKPLESAAWESGYHAAVEAVEGYIRLLEEALDAPRLGSEGVR